MSKIPPTRVTHFECQCHSPDHTLKFTVDPGNDTDHQMPPEIYCQLQMNHYLPWHRRLRIAIRYILGMKANKYSCWDTWIMNSEDSDRLQSVLTEYKIYEELWNKEQANGKHQRDE